MVANICPRCGFPNDPGVTKCRKCKLSYSDSQADHQTLDIYGSPEAKIPAAPGKSPAPLSAADADTSYMVIPRSSSKVHDIKPPPAPAVPAPSMEPTMTLPASEVSVEPVVAEKPSSAPPAKLGLDFSDEAPPGEAPVVVSPEIKRELPLDRRTSRVAVPVAAVDATPAVGTPDKPVRTTDLPRSKGIRITLADTAAQEAGPAEKAEPSEMGSAQEFSDAGPNASSTIHKAAARPRHPDGSTLLPSETPKPKDQSAIAAKAAAPSKAAVSLPGIPVRESWIEYSEPLAPREIVAAGFLRRFTAAAIDLILLGAVASGVAWLGVATFGSDPALEAALMDTGRAITTLGPPLACLFAAVAGIYSLAFHFLAGKTLGKMVVGLRVVTTEGEPLTLWRAAWRTFAYAITCATMLIGFLWILVDERGQALHDKVSGTYVIIEGE